MNYFVDNTAKGSNTGTSWLDAWQSFAAINWATLHNATNPVLYISGGTYNEQMTIGGSGSASNPILIDVGANSPSPSGHDGIVIIDGGGTRTSGIYSEGKSYIHVNGLSGSTLKLLIQNTITGADGDAAVVLRDGTGLYADYIKIDNASNRGVFFYTVTGGRVRGCDIRSGDVDNAYQTDCIYVGRGFGNVVENNYCLLGNNWATGHVDVLQIVGDDGLIVRNNWLEWHTGRGASGDQTLIMEETTGNIFIYNNVMLGCSAASNLMMKDATSGAVYILNNTMIAQNPTGKALLLMYPDEDQIGLIQNNILYSQNEIPLYCNQHLALTGKINNNCLYRVTGTDISYLNGTTRTWAQHQAAGYDTAGVNADPKFVTEFTKLHLQASSPCRFGVTPGADLSAYFTTDKDGVLRPAGQWDIGAYQHKESNTMATTINLTGISSGNLATDPLTVTAVAATPALFTSIVVNYTSPNPTGSIVLTPVVGATGSTVVTITVKNTSTNLMATRTFTVNLKKLNPPTVDQPADVTINT
jgi:hypothetical protein